MDLRGAPGPDAGPSPLLALGRLTDATREVIAALPQLWTLSGEQLVCALEAHHALAAQQDAARLALIRQLDARGHHTTAGATTTAAWLAHHLLTDRTAATADVAAAQALDPDGDLPPQPGQAGQASPGSTTGGASLVLAATGRALLTGHITRAHADAVRTALTALTKLPTGTMPAPEREELHTRAEATLLTECQRLTPAQIRTAGTHLRHLIDPDGVLRDERTAEHRSAFWLTPDTTGAGYRFGGTTDPLTAAQLRTFFDAHTAPRPHTDDQTGDQTGAPTPDPRTPDQRRGHAFADLVRLAVNADPTTSGGQSTHLVITVPLATLHTQPGQRGALCGTTETGRPLSAATLRKLACDTTVIPAVLSAPSEPLDIGRATRTIPVAIRRALNLRDKQCAFPTCDRPQRWADAHHVRHWADGGPTALHNLVLLCHHHDTIHHTGWTVTITNGRPRFTPPMRT